MSASPHLGPAEKAKPNAEACGLWETAAAREKAPAKSGPGSGPKGRLPSGPHLWELRFKELQQFKKRTGTAMFRPDTVRTRSLARWVVNARQTKRHCTITRRNDLLPECDWLLLVAVPGDVEAAHLLFQGVQREHGHCDVPS